MNLGGVNTVTLLGNDLHSLWNVFVVSGSYPFTGWIMLVSEATAFLGKVCDLTLLDRQGHSHTRTVEIFDVGFVPLAGPCLITDSGEFRLDRVKKLQLVPVSQAA